MDIAALLPEYWQLLFVVAIPAAAPVVTAAVNKFGSETTKRRWNKVRAVYRKAFRLEPLK